MLLTVSFKSSISPWTSTLTCLLRSPSATALVTSEMERTWLVRLEAIFCRSSRTRRVRRVNETSKLTLTFLVKSAQVPCTPSTLAWPPSIPWVPTSKATRVTSEAKAESWSTMELTVPFDRGDKEKMKEEGRGTYS